MFLSEILKKADELIYRAYNYYKANKENQCRVTLEILGGLMGMEYENYRVPDPGKERGESMQMEVVKTEIINRLNRASSAIDSNQLAVAKAELKQARTLAEGLGSEKLPANPTPTQEVTP